MTTGTDNWAASDAYENYMGRWSRPLASAFVSWLNPLGGAAWLEVGCGTGALTRAICDRAAPASVVACEPAESFLKHTAGALRDGRVAFVVAGADSLPGLPRSFDYVVSGLVLNFVPEPLAAINHMTERLRPEGVLSAYVWDYADGMEILRRFWDEAAALDPAAAALDEGRRFPLCNPHALESLFGEARLNEIVVEGLEIPTRFRSFEDFWTPFLRGTGPAPSYATSLAPERQALLRQRLVDRLKPEADGGIRLKARAWAIRGVC